MAVEAKSNLSYYYRMRRQLKTHYFQSAYASPWRPTRLYSP